MLWASQQREQRKEDWATAGMDSMFRHEHITRHAAGVGYCNALQEIMNITAEDLENRE